MKFFVDFEATQFSDRIINIGCTTEAGAKFSTLVKPSGKKARKLTAFITELTGITREMIKSAPSANDAFNAFFDFVIENSPTEPNEFYCYGDADILFIEKTLNDITDTRAATFAKRLRNSLIDYSTVVKNYFQAENCIALRKIYSLILNDDVVQHHDALEDAQMLQVVVQNLTRRCVPEDKEKLAAMPTVKKPYPKSSKKLKKAPTKFVEWPPNKLDADTGADETNWDICCVSQNGNDIIKYFDSMDTAALWVMRYASEKMSPKVPEHYDIIKRRINKSINENVVHYNFIWRKNDGLGEV